MGTRPRTGGVASCLFFAALLFCASEGLARTAGAGRGELRPRSLPPKPTTVTRPGFDSILTVKFRDDLMVRARYGGLISEAGGGLSAVGSVSLRHGLDYEPLIRLPQRAIDALERRAALRSGAAQPDLAGIVIVHGPEERLETAARELLLLDDVEWVEFARVTPPPPCTDLAPVTPNYYAQDRQDYHDSDPGVNMSYAWSLGARGQGIEIADCEYGFIEGTEDLCNVVMEPGQTIDPFVVTNGWDDHGTAVLGEMVGLDNAYGVTGLAPDVFSSFFPEWTVEEGPRRVTAIAHAIASVDPGDVVVLEMQTTLFGGDGYGPAELNLAVWNATKVGTDAGVIVVAAAGNGDQDLDSPDYANYMARGDSGAIIVGAGTADTQHRKKSFSTYGSRVNVQGWGEDVFTLGYGSFAELDGDRRQRYTSSFSGTSSATPIVAAVVAVLQSLAEQQLGCRFEPLAMRQLLIDTGIPQGNGGHIGPLPDMQAAADTVLGLPDCSYGSAVCGNDVREGDEECDGPDDDACPGLCVDCACTTPVCGNDVREGDEECDGSDDDACPGFCVDCDCTIPVCGNDLREGDEECDGSDDDACPGLCVDCACTPPPSGPGEPTNLIVLGEVGGKIPVTYTPACSTSGNSIVYGLLRDVASYTFAGQSCEIGNSGFYSSFRPGSDSYFFLVVGHDDEEVEGSYGVDSAGNERPESLNEGSCPRTQNLTHRCD